ncbi:MAG: glycosyltransferase family 4 protein [Patescibacteria group bacterium]|mgnify:CR=1 FL=1
MKLLILTQKVDKDDPILSFFHRWIEEFANYCDKLTVICLAKGRSELPVAIKVLSLGKPAQGWSASGGERLRQKFSAWLNFYKFIWHERKNYDTVFVHMNQEYVLLGALVWKLLGKKILLWRNHPRGNWLTRLAVWLSDRVFCTSEFSFTARFNKTTIMPVGIDTNRFRRDPLVVHKPNSILFLSRMSPIKKPEILIDALHLLAGQGIDFTAALVGDPLPKDQNYYQSLGDAVKKYQLANQIQFIKGVPNEQTPAFYNTYEIFVNLTPTGSLDKTIFEAMACESLVLTSNLSLALILPAGFVFKEGQANDLAVKLKGIFSLTKDGKEDLGRNFRQVVKNKHSLSLLAGKITRRQG